MAAHRHRRRRQREAAPWLRRGWRISRTAEIGARIKRQNCRLKRTTRPIFCSVTTRRESKTPIGMRFSSKPGNLANIPAGAFHGNQPVVAANLQPPAGAPDLPFDDAAAKVLNVGKRTVERAAARGEALGMYPLSARIDVDNLSPTCRTIHAQFTLVVILWSPFVNHGDNLMFTRTLANCTLAALTGAAMLTLSLGSASAFTLASPSSEKSFASSQIDKVQWHHHHRHCWRSRWGHMHCSW